MEQQTSQSENNDPAREFASALRNPVEHVLCRLSAGLQSVLGVLSRAYVRLTEG